MAMALFLAANAPGGVDLGLILRRELQAPDRLLAHAFAVSLVTSMLVVRPAGRAADRRGRRPLLVAGRVIKIAQVALLGTIRSPGSPWPTRPSTVLATSCSP